MNDEDVNHKNKAGLDTNCNMIGSGIEMVKKALV